MFPADGGTRFALQIFEKNPGKNKGGGGVYSIKGYFKKKFQKNFLIFKIELVYI